MAAQQPTPQQAAAAASAANSSARAAVLANSIEATLPPPRPGDAVRLRVPPDCLHWFDPESGLRVGA